MQIALIEQVPCRNRFSTKGDRLRTSSILLLYQYTAEQWGPTVVNSYSYKQYVDTNQYTSYPTNKKILPTTLRIISTLLLNNLKKVGPKISSKHKIPATQYLCTIFLKNRICKLNDTLCTNEDSQTKMYTIK